MEPKDIDMKKSGVSAREHLYEIMCRQIMEPSPLAKMLEANMPPRKPPTPLERLRWKIRDKWDGVRWVIAKFIYPEMPDEDDW